MFGPMDVSDRLPSRAARKASTASRKPPGFSLGTVCEAWAMTSRSPCGKQRSSSSAIRWNSVGLFAPLIRSVGTAIRFAISQVKACGCDDALASATRSRALSAIMRRSAGERRS